MKGLHGLLHKHLKITLDLFQVSFLVYWLFFQVLNWFNFQTFSYFYQWNYNKGQNRLFLQISLMMIELSHVVFLEYRLRC